MTSSSTVRMMPAVSTFFTAGVVAAGNRALGGEQHAVQHPVHADPHDDRQREPGLAELDHTVGHALHREAEQAGEDQRRGVDPATVAGDHAEHLAAIVGVERLGLAGQQRVHERRSECDQRRHDVQEEKDLVTGSVVGSDHRADTTPPIARRRGSP